MTKKEKVEKLMRRTGQGQIACDISLQLSGNDVEKAVQRMKKSYPSAQIK